ncbi:hypothetical protein [Parageobacillus thermoglucosidasius]|uniref:hypothetical protein n=1 Tax=Parageobacillus thermoglucosidasius TaxID=1426 RepID=UPI000B567EF1|nr:hypothetical protein [Parageobacillus thermoglucosidasius]OUM85451.1 MAG: hypothetical protein BAA00_03430 [Parageobacillus thermoglucosidasius]
MDYHGKFHPAIITTVLFESGKGEVQVERRLKNTQAIQNSLNLLFVSIELWSAANAVCVGENSTSSKTGRHRNYICGAT